MVATRRSKANAQKSDSDSPQQSQTPSASGSSTPLRNVSDSDNYASDDDDDFQPIKQVLGRMRTRSAKHNAPSKRLKREAASSSSRNLMASSSIESAGESAEASPALSDRDVAVSIPSASDYETAVEAESLPAADPESEPEATLASEEESEQDSGDDSDDSEGSDSSDEQALNFITARNRRRQNRPVSIPRPWFEKTNDKLLRYHSDLSHVWDNLDKMEAAAVTPIDQPKDLNLPLLPFQRYGVAWMRQQELSDFKGGILADEMGMGKTIQTIALLLTDKKKPNLVVAPTVAIMQWKREIETHTNSTLSVHVFHGTKRVKSVKELNNYDVVLSTYSILENSFRLQEVGRREDDRMRKEESILHQVNWHRVILDEAHNIKDRARNTARSVFNLNSTYKWSLTGTPLQNRVGELYSLIRFMQADPFGYYFCKECSCKKINWEFSNKRGCDTCKHKPMDHVCWWNNEVLKPIQSYGSQSYGHTAMTKLRKLLDRIMLRRTKLECADDLGLPPRTVVIRRDMFNEEEEDVYRSLFTDSARQFTSYVEQGSVLNNYANIFELLMKMRQSANHPDLVTKKKEVSDNKQLVCMLCNEPPEDAIAAACKHVFCRECCRQYLETFIDSGEEVQSRCPSCFANFSVDLSQPGLELEVDDVANSKFAKSSIVNRIDMEKWRSSTKIEALVEELSKLRTEDRTIKSIVFSQFVNFLDLVYWRLSRAGFECIRLDGSMSPQQRDAAIHHFNTKPSCTVFLISLKAGGVALNLTEASRVFICDPWWNPAAELQAMDRIHRLGQHRPIRVTRLVIENSIESRIVQLQEKKMALVDSTIGKDAAALERLSVDDLRFLFVM